MRAIEGMLLLALYFGGLLLPVNAANLGDDSPLSKVITLMEDLRDKIEDGGKEEATTYGEFACFCKDTTEEKSEAITNGQDEIDTQSATLEQETVKSKSLAAEIAKLQNEIEGLNADMNEEVVKRQQEKAKYEFENADMKKAVSSVEKAIDILGNAKKATEFAAVRDTVKSSLAVAEALGVSTPIQRKEAAALLEEDSQAAPKKDYEFRSGGIMKILDDLLKDFKEKNAEVDKLEERAVKAHEELMSARQDTKESAAEAAQTKGEEREQALEEVGKAQEALIAARETLAEDSKYLKELTTECEAKAKEWDQRSNMRAGELEAINQALEILNEKVKGKAENISEAKKASKEKGPPGEEGVGPSSEEGEGPADSFLRISAQGERLTDEDRSDLSFFQIRRSGTKSKPAGFLVQTQKRTPGSEKPASSDPLLAKAIFALKADGARLKSAVLVSVAERLEADPFKKVKQLIQDLIEKLLKQAAEEAEHRGWCGVQMGNAEKERNFKQVRIDTLSAALEKNEAIKGKLEQDLEALSEELAELAEEASKMTEMRAAEKENNLIIMNDAKEAAEAVKEAVAILKEFYAKGSRAKVLLQKKEPEAPAGVEPLGAYKGNQGEGHRIISMLQKVQAGFETTLKETQQAENEAAREFTRFMRDNKASVASKETDQKLKETELDQTKIALKEDMADLRSNQELLDAAIKELEELKPACVDTGMTFEARAAKRDEEVAALKKAMEILSSQ